MLKFLKREFHITSYKYLYNIYITSCFFRGFFLEIPPFLRSQGRHVALRHHGAGIHRDGGHLLGRGFRP